MPAIDQCEEQVVRALEKDGWVTTHRPFAILVDRTRGGYIYADLRLRKQESVDSIIIVEVKCFDSTRTLLDEFYQAVGQYVVYRNALLINDTQTPVYLSVPMDVHRTFFQKPLITSVMKDMQVACVVVDLDKEEIVQWIP